MIAVCLLQVFCAIPATPNDATNSASKLLIKDGTPSDSVYPSVQSDFNQPLEAKNSYRTHMPGINPVFMYGHAKGNTKYTWQIDVAVSIVPLQNSGHHHANPLPELKYYPFWPDKTRTASLQNIVLRSPVLDASDIFDIQLVPPAYAVRVIARGKYFNYSDGRPPSLLTVISDGEIPGLVPLPEAAFYYQYIGGTASHPDTKYGTEATILALQKLAVAWKNICPRCHKLKFGAISLPFGGTLDIHDDWLPTHDNHSFGIAADIHKENIFGPNRGKLLQLLCKSGFIVQDDCEVGHSQKHFHVIYKPEFLRVQNLNWPVDDIYSLPKEGVSNCCAVNPHSNDYLKCLR